ncbi:MAG TPA: CDP-alcohol phosphatidyltransferase family protein [Rubricoccaceae bacterium]|nr:CDP-alcohol phosphatidyltransferase family protein [Rubricoccaceae bacterium]
MSESEFTPLPPSFPAMGRFWTAANVLSLARVALVGPIAWFVYQGGPLAWMFGLIGLAIATDFFDGRVARWSRTVSEWGKVLDATADKLAAASVTVALLLRPPEAGPTLPLWFACVVVVRDVVLIVGGLLQTRRLGRFTSSLPSGKWAVTALAVTVLFALLRADPPVLEGAVYATTAIMAWSLVRYAIRFTAIMRLGPAVCLDEEGNVVRDAEPVAVSPDTSAS